MVEHHGRSTGDRPAVSVDLENGYGPSPGTQPPRSPAPPRPVAVGGSIEDYAATRHLYGPAHAVERVAAAVEAARELGFPFTLTARAENHIRGNPDLDETIARLQAFAHAGTDVLYAPGPARRVAERTVCEAVSKPVICSRRRALVREIADAGAQRVSVGGAFVGRGRRHGRRRRGDPR